MPKAITATGVAYELPCSSPWRSYNDTLYPQARQLAVDARLSSHPSHERGRFANSMASAAAVLFVYRLQLLQPAAPD